MRIRHLVTDVQRADGGDAGDSPEWSPMLENLNLRLKRAMQETHHRIKNNLQVGFPTLVEIPVNRTRSVLDPGDSEAHQTPCREISPRYTHLLTLQAKEDYDFVPYQRPQNHRTPDTDARTDQRRTRICRLRWTSFDMPVREASSLALLVSECDRATPSSTVTGVMRGISLRVADRRRDG